MAFPTILFNTSTGHDTNSSGAGPATAINDTTESTTVTYSGVGPYVITFSGATDLSAVVATGAHVLYLVTSTGRRFFTIEAVNDGANTVDVTEAPAGTTSGLAWAIGGKRATLEHAESRLLFASTNGKAGWIIELEDDQTISTAAMAVSAAGSSTARITLQGTTGALRAITQSGNFQVFIMSGGDWYFKNLHIKHSNATKTNAQGFRVNIAGQFVWEDCELGDATHTLSFGILRNASNFNSAIINCRIHHCTVDGFSTGNSSRSVVLGCTIHDNIGDGIDYLGDSLIVDSCLIYANTGSGINIAASGDWVIRGCTIHGNTGHGIKCDTANDVDRGACYNNNITANAWGIKGPTDYARRSFFDFNNFGAGDTLNSSGTSDNIPIGDNSLSVDPGYTSAGTGDFSVSVAVKALGFPDADVGIGLSSASRTYVDIGAVQRQETGGTRRPHIRQY